MPEPCPGGHDVQHKIRYADPLHAGRHPFQTFLLSLCVVSGIPLLFGQPAPQSMESLLPGWLALAWGLSLAGGAGTALAGSYWPRANYATALTIERVGLLITGPAACVYAVCIVIVAGMSGVVAAGITLGFGASCIMRARDIGKVVERAIATVTGTPRRRVDREGDAS